MASSGVAPVQSCEISDWDEDSDEQQMVNNSDNEAEGPLPEQAYGEVSTSPLLKNRGRNLD